jgi:polyketide synthase 12/myxalamid-type polyketide synthase MxaF
VLEAEPADLDIRIDLSSYGLDSAKAVFLAAALSAETGRALKPTLFWEYPTIESLSEFLGGADKTPAVKEYARRTRPVNEPIAVIGMACRFPKASDPNAFWQLLATGTDAIVEIPAERWSVDEFYDPDPEKPGKMHARRCGMLDRVDEFDAAFFGISPREAVQMDPQQRLMLELAWEVTEDAGIPVEHLRDTQTGVFVGVVWQDYARLQQQYAVAADSHTGPGQALSIIANRISYAFGLHGPSMALDTACSSSLVAIHLACQSLRSGESTMAFAGGVNLILSPETMVSLAKFGGLSSDCCSRAFDAAASGYARGEGAGIVLLKSVSTALADGDPIYCVIRGSAVNNDGASNGLSAPNPRAQEMVLREACRNANVDPADIHYVEAHGPGTVLGDPIEAGALGAVLGAARSPDRPLIIGSVKTNIGHLEGAAGIAGFIKVALSIKNNAIPASLNYVRPNPYIAFEDWNIRVQTTLGPWPCKERTPLAGISAFGWGGTNCHVVLEGFPVANAQILAVSAPSPQELRENIERIARSTSGLSLAPHSNAHPCRLAAVIRHEQEVVEILESHLAGQPVARLYANLSSSNSRNLVFVFSAQGSQWNGMARELLRQEPAFRVKLQECDREFFHLAGYSLLDRLLTDPVQTGMGDVSVIQPLLFAIQVSLAALWKSWGIVPDAVIGHSLGEVAAAEVSGVLSLADAVHVIFHYSRLQATLANLGGMALVDVPAPALSEYLDGTNGEVCIAGYNSPSATVLSGEPRSLDRVLADIGKKGIFCAPIQVNVAAHSAQIDFISEELSESLAGVQPLAPAIPMISTLTGTEVVDGQLGGSYWAQNLRQPVLFSQAVSEALSQGHNLFLELSPHPILTRAIEQSIVASERQARALPVLRRQENSRSTLLEALCAVYVAGKPVRWDRVTGDPDPETLSRTEVFTLSAKSPAALQALAANSIIWISRHPLSSLEDIAYSAAVGRTHHDHRFASVVRSRHELLRNLGLVANGELRIDPSAGRKTARPSLLTFVFCGQGPDWYGMGRELLQREPIFRDVLVRCDRLLRQYTDWSLLEELDKNEENSRLQDSTVAQPGFFALQMGLAALWRSWGIVPDAVVGHSLGEVAAACVAGALSLEDGIRVVFTRGRLMQESKGQGRMATVEMPLADAETLVAGYPGKLWIAAINSPTSIVLSGEPSAIHDVIREMERRKIFCRLIPVNYASHNGLVDLLRAELQDALSGIIPRMPDIPIASAVRGNWSEPGDFGSTYWGRNIRETVRFSAALETLFAAGHTQFLEIGTHPVLEMPISQCLAAGHKQGMVLASLRRGQPERASLLASLAQLYAAGRQVNWHSVYPVGRFLRLPSYAFQRKRYWLSSAVPASSKPEVRFDSEITLRPQIKPVQPDRKGMLLNRIRTVSASERHEFLSQYVGDQVIGILGLDRSDSFDFEQGFFELGMTSMMAMELKRRLEADLDCKLARTLVFEYSSVVALSGFLSAEFASHGTAAETAMTTEQFQDTPAGEFESDFELDEKLKALEAKFR